MFSFFSLFDEAVDEDGLFDVEVLTALETDGDGAVDDVEGAMAFDFAGIDAQLAAKPIAVGMSRIDVGPGDSVAFGVPQNTRP